jgi:hypothetical protein
VKGEGGKDGPSNHLTSHLRILVSVLPGETEIGYFEDAIGGNEQIVRFHILRVLRAVNDSIEGRVTLKAY